MTTCEVVAGPSTVCCVENCELVEPDEFLSLATSRMPVQRISGPAEGQVALIDISSGRCVAVESKNLGKHRSRVG